MFPRKDKEDQQEEPIIDTTDETDNADLADENKPTVTKSKSKKVVAPEEQDITDENVPIQDENAGEQVTDEINKIRTDK